MKNLSDFFIRTVTVILISILFILLFGSFNYWIEGMLIFFRWPLIIISAIVIFYLHFKEIKWIKLGLLSLTLLVIGEWAWHNLQYQSPTTLSSTGGDTLELKVMTCNLEFTGKDSEITLEKLLKYDSDILMVQELTLEWSEILKSTLAKSFPHHVVNPFNGPSGLGIFSKYELGEQLIISDSISRPLAQCVVADILGKPVYLCNVHFDSPERALATPKEFTTLLNHNIQKRGEEWIALANALERNAVGAKGTILGGSLNTPEFDPLYRTVRKKFVDVYAYTGVGNGKTFPSRDNKKPYVKFDYIMINGSIEPLRSRVLERTGSDHYPLMAKVKL